VAGQGGNPTFPLKFIYNMALKFLTYRPAPILPPPYSPVERDPPYAPHYSTDMDTEKADTAEDRKDTATHQTPAPKYSYINS
jgi:hypothetical protein